MPLAVEQGYREADGISRGIQQMDMETTETDDTEMPVAITITCPETLVEEDTIHNLFTGYNEEWQMVVCQNITFTSQREMTQTLR